MHRKQNVFSFAHQPSNYISIQSDVPCFWFEFHRILWFVHFILCWFQCSVHHRIWNASLHCLVCCSFQEKALEHSSSSKDTAILHSNMSQVYLKQEKWNDAAREAEKATVADEMNFKAFYRWAQAVNCFLPVIHLSWYHDSLLQDYKYFILYLSWTAFMFVVFVGTCYYVVVVFSGGEIGQRGNGSNKRKSGVGHWSRK